MSSSARALRRLASELPTAKAFFVATICVLTPGLAFYFNGWRKVGSSILAGCVVALMLFFVCMGYAIADWAYMAVLSAHVASISQLIQRQIGRERFVIQCVAGAILFGAISQLVYVPARDWIYSNVALPLRTSNGVVIVKPSANPDKVTRSCWVAYRFEGRYENGIALKSGYGLGPVLAVPGSRVKFGTQRFEVDGVSHPNLTHMPVTGEVAVPKNYWFIWPDLHIGGNGIAVSVLAGEMQRLAMVEHGSFVGRPYNRWFFRKQIKS
jgi:hypothetical protein